jgi:DNA-binding NarL/FixJ family response regulator
MGHAEESRGRRGRAGTVSLLLAEPNSMLREKMAGILGRYERIWCVTQVCSKAELVRAASQIRPDYIIADISLVKSPDLVDVLRGVSLGSRIFALVDRKAEPYERLVEHLGLHGLFERSRVVEDMTRVIDSIHSVQEKGDDEEG